MSQRKARTAYPWSLLLLGRGIGILAVAAILGGCLDLGTTAPDSDDNDEGDDGDDVAIQAPGSTDLSPPQGLHL